MALLIGNEAESFLKLALKAKEEKDNKYKDVPHYGIYCKYNDVDTIYICFDNRSKDLWVEEFPLKEGNKAIAWLNGEHVEAGLSKTF